MEKEQKNIEKQKDGENAAAAAVDCSKKHRTFGNKLFDWLIYGSVSFVGVSTMSLLTVHEAKYGAKPMFNWLRSMNKGFTEFLEKRVFKHIINDKKAAPDWASGTSMFWMLGFGGSALSPVLKYLEDNRQKLSAKIDNFFGTTPPDDSLILHEPKQSWLSVAAGRVAAIGTGYLSFMAMGPKFASNISHWLGEHSTKAFMKLSPKSNAGNVRRWMDIAVFDVLFTAVTASATYVISRFVARNTDDVPDDCAPSKPATAPTTTEPSHTLTEKRYSSAPKKIPASSQHAGGYAENLTTMRANSQELRAQL